MATYAHVTRFPVRITTEYLIAPGFRSVTISALLLNPRPHDVTRMFTSSAIIASLADILNSLQAAPDVTTSCLNPVVSYQLKFSPRDRRASEVIASTAGCEGVEGHYRGNTAARALGSG
jgi:hypothetical protein